MLGPQPEKNNHLMGLVDMGSNGIRFSITDLSPPTTRVLPTVFVDRAAISLYDAQYDEDTGKKVPIPAQVIRKVATEFNRFTRVCREFGVPLNRIRVIATEATRTAINSEEFRDYIKDKTGLEVEMLTKEQEGNVGAMGIVSSFSDVRGLVMDLGGGSCQVTWIISQDGMVRTSPKIAVSFPYGAAAVTRRLAECRKAKDPDKALDDFKTEIRANFRKAYDDLEIPAELVDQARREGGFHLYLSGGGFRGWGYLLLSQSQKHGHDYPISIINGFKVDRAELIDTERLKDVARHAERIFRVSDRRRYQVPAVAFLINVLSNRLPLGVTVGRFCQGGVREGFLFRDLPASVRAQHPIAVASAPFARPSAPHFKELILNALPAPLSGRSVPREITSHIIEGLANLAFQHATLSKEIASVAALYCTTTGVLASAHGLSHSSRARIALMLENRYDGELPPRELTLKHRLSDLLTPEEIWWCNYCGVITWLIGQVYPTGVVGPRHKMWFSARFIDVVAEYAEAPAVELTISVPQRSSADDDEEDEEAVEEDVGEDDDDDDDDDDEFHDDMLVVGNRRMDKYAKRVAKVGKKKNWVGGKGGWGLRVKVIVSEQLAIEPGALRVDA